ncbi:glycerol-3-phosphate responsive antiterminator [Roseburia hominis]
MDQKVFDMLEGSPVIAAVKDEEGLQVSCDAEEIRVLFILFGDICNISQIVKKAKDAGKTVFVHMDLIQGLSAKDIAVDFIKKNTQADGIITTKPPLIPRAKELGFCTVLRFFVLDSLALENVQRQQSVKPDFIEILPGVMPKIIRRLCKDSKVPIIAGGLIADREDVVNALDAGAFSVSTTNQQVWFM